MVNNALELTGHKIRIAGLYDGSLEATIARDHWRQTLDTSLALQPWEFARSQRALTLSMLGVLPRGWTHKWLVPTDTITVLDVFRLLPDPMNPLPSTWQEANNATEWVVLTYFSDANAALTVRINDTELWSAPFTFVMIESLAKRLAPYLEDDDAPRRHREQRAGPDRPPNAHREYA